LVIVYRWVFILNRKNYMICFNFNISVSNELCYLNIKRRTPCIYLYISLLIFCNLHVYQKYAQMKRRTCIRCQNLDVKNYFSLLTWPMQ
jgi:small basic protein